MDNYKLPTEWRLPTHDELMSLVQADCGKQIVHPVFRQSSGGVVWTSSPSADGMAFWVVDFSTGYDDISGGKANRFVRLGRGYSFEALRAKMAQWERS